MKINQILLAALSCLSLSGIASAGALTWIDRDPDTGVGPLKYLSVGGTTSYTSTFNIADAGYDPTKHVIDSIIAKFAFADDADRKDGDKSGQDKEEYVDVILGSVTLWNDLEVDGDHDSPTSSYDWWITDNLFGNLTIKNDLAFDGIISYSVAIQDKKGSKDTYLKIAELCVTGDLKPTPDTQSVPDGGTTIALLGVSLLGLHGLRRKLTGA